MSIQTTVFIPMGNVLAFTSDAITSGYYTRLGEPGGTTYTPSAIAVSTAYTVGPFNEPRDYIFDYEGAVLSFSQSYSGVVTAVDDALVAAKRPLVDPIVVHSANGAIALTAGIKKITKAGVCALTLAAPVVGDDGLIIHVVSRTDNAHTVTATGLIDNGVTGGSKTTATFAAFAGASMTLMAIDLKWHVLALNAVTVA